MSPKTLLRNVMRKGGLEPPRIAPLDPKSKNNAPQSQHSEERKLTKAVENGRIRSTPATFSATAHLFDPPFRALLIWKWCAVALLMLSACAPQGPHWEFTCTSQHAEIRTDISPAPIGLKLGSGLYMYVHTVSVCDSHDSTWVIPDGREEP